MLDFGQVNVGTFGICEYFHSISFMVDRNFVVINHLYLEFYVHHCSDLMSLARAAVSGDEDALDMFNWKKGNQGGQNGAQGANMRISAASLGNQEATAFFLGGQTG